VEVKRAGISCEVLQQCSVDSPELFQTWAEITFKEPVTCNTFSKLPVLLVDHKSWM